MILRIKNQVRFIFLKIASLVVKSKKVRYFGIDFDLTVGNSHELQRALTFQTKEPDTLEWLKYYSDKGVDLIDVGANVGIYSLYFAKASDKGVRVLSFEPDASSFTSLNTNIAINDLENIEAYMLALSNQHSWVDLKLSIYEPGAGAGSIEGDYIFTRAQKDNRVNQKVMAVRGDDFFAELNLQRPVIMKIDVDGHEKDIIKGMRSFMKSDQVLSLIIEINWKSEADLADVSGLIEDCGFSLVGRGCWSQSWEGYTVANYLFCKSEEKSGMSSLKKFTV